MPFFLVFVSPPLVVVNLEFAAQTFMLPALIPPSKIEEEARAFQINESKKHAAEVGDVRDAAAGGRHR